ncbi:MAG TPA: hypothetical protein VFU37_11925 [Pyrinomonadaceae bacterium]|nr:hypothetical protein [Pyrinomonadaceae bacterium]
MDVARLNHGDETVIVGTSGFALELAGLLNDNHITVRGCIGPIAPHSTELNYLGDDDCIKDWRHLPMLVALGEPELRRTLFERLQLADARLGTFVDSQAYVSSFSSIAEGVIVYPHATVHAWVTLERGVLINSNSSIGHETHIGAFTTVGPGSSLGGKIWLGERVYVGIGATMIEEITVADGTILGAGTVVVRNCDQPGTYVGVPARLLSS